MAELILFTKGSGTGKGAQWYINYTTSVIGPGKTKVDWGLYKRKTEGNTSKDNILSTTIEFYITGNIAEAEGDLNIEKDQSTGEIVRLYIEPPRFNDDPPKNPHRNYKASNNTTPTYKGAFVIQHALDGTGSFSAQLNAAIYTQSMSTGAVCTVNLDTNLPRTPCFWDNPQIYIDRKYIGPGRIFTITWEGAKPGVDNNIDRFEVTYKIGDGDWIAVDDDVDDSDFVCNCQLPADAARGKIITVKVSIIGENDDSDVTVTKEVGYVNIAPTPLVITSYDGQHTNNVLSFQTQQVSFRYEEPIKGDQQSKARFKIGADGDWIEGSKGYVSLTRPEGQSPFDVYFESYDGEESAGDAKTFYENSTELLDFDIGNLLTDLILDLQFPDSPSVSAEKNGGYYYTIVFNESTNFMYKGEKSVDVRSFYENLKEEGNYSYALKIQLSDGVDMIESNYNGNFTVPRLTIYTTYNNQPFFRYTDSDIISVSNNASSSQNWTYVRPGEEQNKQINTLIFQQNKDTSEFKITLNNPLKRVSDILIDFTTNNNTYRPYTEALALNGKLDSSGGWGQYGLTSAPSISFSFNQIDWYSATPSQDSSIDHLEYTISGNYAYNITTGTYGKQYLNYYYKDEAGYTVTHICPTQILLNFSEPPRAYNNEFWPYATDATNNLTNSVKDWGALKEGMGLSLKLQVAAFSKPRAELQIQRIGSQAWETFGAFGDGTSLGTTTAQADGAQFNTNATIYKFEGVLNINEVTEDGDYYIRILLTSDGETAAYGSNKDSIKLIRHVQPRVSFTDLSYSDGKIIGTYRIDYSGAENYTIVALDGYIKEEVEGERRLTGTLQETTVSFEYKKKDWNLLNFAPILKTSCGITLSSGKVCFVSIKETNFADYNFLVCYNITPTVSYRQNYIGINTNSFDGQDTVAMISQYGDRNKLILSGNVDGVVHTASITLSNGGMNGFVVDAGTWDNIPGGIIPGHGDTPTNLATIAYTGEISDLEQEATIEIHLIAGGAPI